MYKLWTSILIVLSIALSVPISAFASARENNLYTHMTVGIVGNISVTDEQIRQSKTAGGYDFSPLFENVGEKLSDYDITAGFLGVPIDRNGAPAELVTAMKNAGIDFVSTASNNALDCGEEGMLHTIDTLERYGIRHSGTYRDVNDATKPTVFTINGINVGFFSYSTNTRYKLEGNSTSYVSVLGSHNEAPDGEQTTDAWSVLALPQQKYIKQVESEISAVRDEMDFIITFVSCDETDSEDYKNTWADVMIRAGADFVVFSDGETVDAMKYTVVKLDEKYGRRTAYFRSVGNATMDIKAENSDEGIIFVLSLGVANGYTYVKGVQFVPLYIDAGRMLPVYDYLRYSDMQTDKKIRMAEIVNKQTDTLMQNGDDKRLRSIYQIRPYVGNSESADEIPSYTGRLMILIFVATVLLVVLGLCFFRGKQLIEVIRKTKEREEERI